MIQVFKIINGIDDINCEFFFNLLIMMAQEIPMKNYIFNMLEHKVKNVLLVEDLHLFLLLLLPEKCSFKSLKINA